ncbi:DUF6734 family protein, partial [Mucilaginibacter sp.]|uniref:DUF6734 family protein n=1 Tax=Mucilaginibacter sp. TaxID=1882438 RepID=UPI0028473A2E
MKFLQSLWTGPSGSSDVNLLNLKAGWQSCEFHWMSWALSCLNAKNNLGEVHLITDLKGKEILIDQLQLPYATVSADLEKRLDEYPVDLFALAKIYSYSIQEEPFLHLDSDVYFFQKPPKTFFDNSLIAQNLDKNLPIYYHALNEINDNFSYIPAVFSKENYEHLDLNASNAGILGGNHPEFFKKYSCEAFDFIDQNRDSFDKLRMGSLNFIFEQYLFCQLAKKENIPIAYLKGEVDNPVFLDYIKFDDFPDVQMIHPVGNFKKYRHVCNHVAKKLRADYPEYYYRIIDVVKKTGIEMSSRVYLMPNFKYEGSMLPDKISDFIKPEGNSERSRTKAAMDYLNHKYALDFQFNAGDEINDDLVQSFLALIAEENDRECLLDLLAVESQENSLFKELYNEPGSVQRLYDDDVMAYKRIQTTFCMPEQDWLSVKLTVKKNSRLVETGWNWKYDFTENIEAIIEQNFDLEKSAYTALLVPDILPLNIREYYIDELDLLIFHNIKDIITIDELISRMGQYFDEEEIEADYLSFRKLIVGIVKQLL